MYRSLRFLELAAPVPSAGTITPQIDLRLGVGAIGNRVWASSLCLRLSHCLQRGALLWKDERRFSWRAADGSMKPAEEARNMWFSLFTVVLAAAICLSVASFIMREAKARS